MSAEENFEKAQEVLSIVLPLVSDTCVYDFTRVRNRKLNDARDVDGANREALCADGVCVVSWRPRKPRNDAA